MMRSIVRLPSCNIVIVVQEIVVVAAVVDVGAIVRYYLASTRVAHRGDVGAQKGSTRSTAPPGKVHFPAKI